MIMHHSPGKTAVAATVLFAAALLTGAAAAPASSSDPGGRGQYRDMPPQTALAIVNARLVDGNGGPPLENAVIVMARGRFAAAGRAGDVEIPAGAAIIDAGGRTALPGLIDAHFHMCYPDSREQPFLLNEAVSAFRAADHLRRHLMGGITTVMDAGGYRNVGVMAKRAFAEGHLLGSRPIVSGERINATGGHGVSRFDMAVQADGPDEFRKAVRAQIRSGADLIKILPPYTREELAAALDEAHRLRKIVAVHSGYLGDQYDYIRWAAELGADVIEHAYALPDEVIAEMGRKKITGVPTMTVMMKLHAAGRPLDESRPHAYEIIFGKMKAAGVRMAIGTDAIYELKREDPGLYFEEVERFVKNGYTPGEAIVAATRVGAEVCGAADRLGTVEAGKIADLILVDGDPLRTIADLRRVRLILQGGMVVKNDLAPAGESHARRD
jgi:imidazolonepropionase-like amidohydrolase